MKGFLTWHDEPFRRVHNLEEIGGQCVSLDGGLAGIVEGATSLTKFVSRFRYPGAPYETEAEDVATFVATARSVFDAVIARLPEDARP